MKYQYQYQTFKTDIEILYNRIKNQNFTPDVIYGVIRGGLVPAIYLSHRFQNPNIKSLTFQRIDNSENKKIINIESLEKDLSENKKVLIVEDIVDSGESLHHIDTYLNNKENYNNILYVSLWNNIARSYGPIVISIHEIDRKNDSRWIVFPWEI